MNERIKKMYESSKSTIVGISIFVGLEAVALFGLPSLANLYYNKDQDYTVQDTRFMSKVDGPLTYTELEISDSTYKVSHDGIWKHRISYTDINGDGLVDRIYMPGRTFGKGAAGRSRYYDGSKDFEGNEDLFKAFDSDYKEQLERFNIKLPDKGKN